MSAPPEQSKGFACHSCTRRKVKCDKEIPCCGTCKRLKAECTYGDPTSKKRKREPDAERLERYERLLKKHGLLNEKPDEPASITLPTTGRLYSTSGSQRYVDSTLWKSFGGSDGEIIAAHDEPSAASPFAGPILGISQTPTDLQSHLPSSQMARVLWDLYKDRVDPIIKIVHVPSTEALMQQSSFSRSEECLIFAMYFFAASALTEAESLSILGQERDQIVNTYYSCANQALVNADFLRTTNVQVMQAFVMLLIATRGRTDVQLYWISVGVAMRIAQRMGLHRDGSITGLDPFEAEINRRLFWQLPSLEGSAAQFAGIGITSLGTFAWDIKQPLNINDNDIWPGMLNAPTERKGATDMIFLLVRSHFSNFYKEFIKTLHQLELDPDNIALASKADARIDEVEDSLESQFLRYCDPMEPLHLCASLMARVAVQASRFRIKLPRAKSGGMPADELHDLLTLALQIIDRFVVSQTNHNLSKFHVHTASFVIWDILVFMINHIQRATPGDQDATWQRLASLYDCQEHLLTLKLPIAQALSKLVLRAWDTSARPSTSEPGFIARIRTTLTTGTPVQPVQYDSVISQQDVDDFDWAFWDNLIRDPESSTLGRL